MKQRTFSLLVDNTTGVLSRIAGLYSRRGYNIDSITAGVTADPRFTRITIVATADDDNALDQIEKQMAKLVDVRDIKVLKPGNSVEREVVLIKIRADVQDRQNLSSIADIFRAKIVDVSPSSMIIQIVGSVKKTEAFINLLDGYEILEIARTGVTGLSRGMDDVVYL